MWYNTNCTLLIICLDKNVFAYVLWDNRKHILVAAPSAWHRAPETLVISQTIRAGSAPLVLWWWFWVGSWMRVDHQKDRARIRRVGFSAPPPFSREGRGAGNGVINNHCLYLCQEASIKSQNIKFREVPGGLTHPRWVLSHVPGKYFLSPSLSHVLLFATPRTVACQAPLSMGFSRQEYWSGSSFPFPGRVIHHSTCPQDPPRPHSLSSSSASFLSYPFS